MIKKIIEIISNVTCRECGAIYGYDEHDEMIKKAAEDIVKLKIIPRCEEKILAITKIEAGIYLKFSKELNLSLSDCGKIVKFIIKENDDLVALVLNEVD